MAVTIYPVAKGDGSNVSELEWSDMVLFFRENGVLADQLNEMEPSANDPGVSMVVDIDTGEMFQQGHYIQSSTLVQKTISTNAGPGDRTDIIVLRIDRTNKETTGTVASIELKEGTTTLTQNTTIWEELISTITVPAGVSYLTSGNVADSRTYSEQGTFEYASTAETNTGSATDKAVTPNGLSESKFGQRVIEWRVVAHDVSLEAGTGQDYFVVPSIIDGYDLVDFDIAVDTPSSSGEVEVQIYNETTGHDMLSTVATVDQDEYSSYTAVTAPVIDTSYDDLSTGDRIRCDIDDAGDSSAGLVLLMTVQQP